MKPALPRRVQNLEERLPLKRSGGAMIVILQAGEDARGPFAPWYDHRGQPHAPVIVTQDPRPADVPVFVGGDLHERSESDYDDGDEELE